MGFVARNGIPERKDVTLEIERLKREQAERDALRPTRERAGIRYAAAPGSLVTREDLVLRGRTLENSAYAAGKSQPSHTQQTRHSDEVDVVREEVTIGRRTVGRIIRDAITRAEHRR